LGKGSEGADVPLTHAVRALFVKEIFLNIKYYVIIYYFKKCHQKQQNEKMLLVEENYEVWGFRLSLLLLLLLPPLNRIVPSRWLWLRPKSNNNSNSSLLIFQKHKSLRGILFLQLRRQMSQ
jgi:hypothetical protein